MIKKLNKLNKIILRAQKYCIYGSGIGDDEFKVNKIQSSALKVINIYIDIFEEENIKWLIFDISKSNEFHVGCWVKMYLCKKIVGIKFTTRMIVCIFPVRTIFSEKATCAMQVEFYRDVRSLFS